ncbi:hypothetical protein CsSME_00035735 [Camellia sinensis var. sinensis]
MPVTVLLCNIVKNIKLQFWGLLDFQVPMLSIELSFLEMFGETNNYNLMLHITSESSWKIIASSSIK